MISYTPEILMQRFCTTCFGLDAECESCSGMGFHASRLEIKNWRTADEQQVSKARSNLLKATRAMRAFEMSDDPQRMFEQSQASLLFPTIEAMYASVEKDIRWLEGYITAGEHMVGMWDRCLERIDAARARRKETERAERAAPEAPPPAPIEKPTCAEPGCDREAYATDDEGIDWCKRHAHARGLLQRDAVPESDPDTAEPLAVDGNASPQAPGRGYRFVGGPANDRVIEVPRGMTEWEVDGVTYHKRGNAFVTRS